MRKDACVQVDNEILERAGELGLDVPKFCARALTKAIEALETNESETTPASS